MPGASHIRLSPACSPLARGALVVVLALVLGACRRGEPSLSIGDPVSLAWTLAQDAPRTPEGSRLIGQLTLDVVVTGGPARTQVEHETELRALLTRLLEAELAVERAPEELLPRLRELAPEPLTSGGWRLERLEGALSLPGGVRRPDLVPTTDLRVLLVGLDGHDWDIARPLMEAGRLPVLSKLVDGGVSGRLASLEPLLSPVVWTSIATGCRPEEHGILDFLGVSASGQPVPVTSNLRKRRAFWNVLSEAGVDVGVVAWWASWPAEPVEGFLVSDRVAYQTFGGFKSSPAVGLVHPPVLWKELAGQRVRPEEIGPSELGRFHDASVREGWTREDDRLLKDLREKLASAKSYARMSVNLHREERPRVGAYYYQLPDQVAHLFMRYADPPLPEVDPNRQRRFRRAVTAAYERHDQLLGELLSEADERTVVMVVSDHGFRTGRERPSTASRVESPTAADWHARFGIIAMSGPAVRAGVVIEEATVLDVFPTLLALLGMPVAEDLAGRVLEEALTEEFLAAHPVRTVESFETEPLRSATPVGAAPGDEALLESLMAIGYVGGAPATSSGTDDGGSEGAGADPVHAANAHNNRATIHLGLGEIEQARVELAAALALSPDFHQARLNLARVHLRQGDDDAAAKELAEVLTRSPGHVAALSLRSEVELGRGRLDAAEADVRAAIESQPRHAASWHQLGRIQEVRRSLDEAVSSFETAAELDPENPEPRNALGNLHAAAGRHQQALVEYEAAVTADPHFAPAHANLALQCQRLGDFQRAFQVYERARESL
ncbi:MAG: alkaline phosphatase family protein, partial [Acidobacteriota bacterium]